MDTYGTGVLPASLGNAVQLVRMIPNFTENPTLESAFVPPTVNSAGSNTQLQIEGSQKYCSSQYKDGQGQGVQLTISVEGDDVQERLQSIQFVDKQLDRIVKVFMPAKKKPYNKFLIYIVPTSISTLTRLAIQHVVHTTMKYLLIMRLVCYQLINLVSCESIKIHSV